MRVRFTPDCPSWFGYESPTDAVVVELNGDSIDVELPDGVEPVDAEMCDPVSSGDAERAEIDALTDDP